MKKSFLLVLLALLALEPVSGAETESGVFSALTGDKLYNSPQSTWTLAPRARRPETKTQQSVAGQMVESVPTANPFAVLSLDDELPVNGKKERPAAFPHKVQWGRVSRKRGWKKPVRAAHPGRFGEIFEIPAAVSPQLAVSENSVSTPAAPPVNPNRLRVDNELLATKLLSLWRGGNRRDEIERVFKEAVALQGRWKTAEELASFLSGIPRGKKIPETSVRNLIQQALAGKISGPESRSTNAKAVVGEQNVSSSVVPVPIQPEDQSSLPAAKPVHGTRSNSSSNSLPTSPSVNAVSQFGALRGIEDALLDVWQLYEQQSPATLTGSAWFSKQLSERQNLKDQGFTPEHLGWLMQMLRLDLTDSVRQESIASFLKNGLQYYRHPAFSEKPLPNTSPQKQRIGAPFTKKGRSPATWAGSAVGAAALALALMGPELFSRHQRKIMRFAQDAKARRLSRSQVVRGILAVVAGGAALGLGAKAAWEANKSSRVQ